MSQCCPHLIDVLYTLHSLDSQAWNVELTAAIWTHLYLQLVIKVLPKQVPEAKHTSQIRLLSALLHNSVTMGDTGTQCHLTGPKGPLANYDLGNSVSIDLP